MCTQNAHFNKDKYTRFEQVGYTPLQYMAGITHGLLKGRLFPPFPPSPRVPKSPQGSPKHPGDLGNCTRTGHPDLYLAMGQFQEKHPNKMKWFGNIISRKSRISKNSFNLNYSSFLAFCASEQILRFRGLLSGGCARKTQLRWLQALGFK